MFWIYWVKWNIILKFLIIFFYLLKKKKRLQSDTTEQLTLPHFSDRRVTKIQLLFATFLEES